MYSCWNHGPYSGARCPECEKIALLEKQNKILEKNRDDENRRNYERRRADEENRRQNEIFQQTLIAAEIAKNSALIEIENERLSEQKKQTKILLESTLNSEEIYNSAYQWNFDLPVKLSFGKNGSIAFKNENPYVLEKLEKAFTNGLIDRLKEEINQDMLLDKSFFLSGAFNAGLEGSSKIIFEYTTPFLAEKNYSLVKRIEILQEDMEKFKLKIDDRINGELVNCKSESHYISKLGKPKISQYPFYEAINSITGEIEISIPSDKIKTSILNQYPDETDFANQIYESYLNGLNEFIRTYLDKINSTLNVKDRLEIIRKNQNKIEVQNNEELWQRLRKKDLKEQENRKKKLIAGSFGFLGVLLFVYCVNEFIEVAHIETAFQFFYFVKWSPTTYPKIFWGMLIGGMTFVYATIRILVLTVNSVDLETPY